MPFVYNFNDVSDVRTMSVMPSHWNGPITIEYCEDFAHNYDYEISILFRVKGTTHTFCNYEKYVSKKYGNDLKKYFIEVLDDFAEDYYTWWETKDYDKCLWKEEYREQYYYYIKPKGM